jgi:hypothetical protein
VKNLSKTALGSTSYPKPWEFGQSKFDGLLGGRKPDEFFDD